MFASRKVKVGLNIILEELEYMGQALDDLSTKVDAIVASNAQLATDNQALIALLQQVQAALVNAIASGNPAEIQAISDKLTGLATSIAAEDAADVAANPDRKV